MKKLVVFISFIIIFSTFVNAESFTVNGKTYACFDTCEEVGYSYNNDYWWNANKEICEAAGNQCSSLTENLTNSPRNNLTGCFQQVVSLKEKYCRPLQNYNATKQPLIPINISQGGAIARYAQQYKGCPYSKSSDPGLLTPKNCRNGGLTCATFVHSVYWFSLGKQTHGNGNQVCNSEGMVGFKVEKKLQPGDVVSLNGLTTDFSKTYGHTALYVGKGNIVDEKFIPNKNGKPVFIHSTPKYVQYNYLNYFLTDSGNYRLKTFCRYQSLI